MEQELRSNKRVARPSHGAVENKIGDSRLTDKSKQEKVDQVAMQGAKRAQNRILNNEEKLPGSTIFSKQQAVHHGSAWPHSHAGVRPSLVRVMQTLRILYNR